MEVYVMVSILRYPGWSGTCSITAGWLRSRTMLGAIPTPLLGSAWGNWNARHQEMTPPKFKHALLTRTKRVSNATKGLASYGERRSLSQLFKCLFLPCIYVDWLYIYILLYSCDGSTPENYVYLIVVRIFVYIGHADKPFAVKWHSHIFPQ